MSLSSLKIMKKSPITEYSDLGLGVYIDISQDGQHKGDAQLWNEGNL